MNRIYSVLAVAIVIAVLGLSQLFGDNGSHNATGPAPQASTPPRTWDEPIWTGGVENADHHWQKHGGEFPEFSDRDAYIAGAHAFIDHPPSGTLTKPRDNGDTLFYDPSSNTFAVRASNGAPRTFFRPDNGMAYWERQ